MLEEEPEPIPNDEYLSFSNGQDHDKPGNGIDVPALQAHCAALEARLEHPAMRELERGIEEGGEGTAERPYPSLNLDQFLMQSFVERDYFILPLIPATGISMFYSAGEAGKTPLALAMSLCIAAGKDFLKYPCRQQGNVTYFDGELQSNMVQRFIRTQCWALQINPKEIKERFHMVSDDALYNLHRDSISSLYFPEGQARAEATLEQNGSNMAMFDNLGTLFVGAEADENSVAFFAPIYEWLKKLVRKGVGVALYHHSNKEGGYRGTSKMQNHVDNMIRVEKAENFPERGNCVLGYWLNMNDPPNTKVRGYSGELRFQKQEIYLMCDGDVDDVDTEKWYEIVDADDQEQKAFWGWLDTPKKAREPKSIAAYAKAFKRSYKQLRRWAAEYDTMMQQNDSNYVRDHGYATNKNYYD